MDGWKERRGEAESVCRALGPSSIGSKVIYEILEQCQVLDCQILELHAASSRADLCPGVFRQFVIMYDSAFDPVYVDEMVVVAEYFHFGTPISILVYSQIPDAKPPKADILDLSHIDEFIGSYKSGECPFFDFESLELSIFLKHFLPLFQVPPGQEPFPDGNQHRFNSPTYCLQHFH